MPFNTAIHAQYQEIYTTYTQKYGSKVCVCMCVGRFYEFYALQDKNTQQYDNNLPILVEMLGIQTSVYADEKLHPMIGVVAGFPDYTLDKWAGKLTSAGWHVVVVDQTATKIDGKIQRDVTRVLSPGTHIESADTNQPFYLACVYMDTTSSSVSCPSSSVPCPSSVPSYGVTAIDLTDGSVCLYEGKALGSGNTWHADDLRHFFQLHPPRELIYCWKGPTLYQPDEETLRRNLYLPQCPIYDYSERPQIEQALQREEYLRTCFTPNTSLPLRTWLHIHDKPYAERSLTMALRFVEDHVHNLLGSLQAPTVWHPSDSLRIINNALEQLQVISSDPSKITVQSLFVSPYTSFGKRAFQTYVCTPIADANQIQLRQQQLKWIIDQPPSTQQNISSCLQLMYDLPRIHRAIVRGDITSTTIYQCYQTYMATKQLCDFISISDSPFANPNIQNYLDTCITTLQTHFDTSRLSNAIENPDMYTYLQKDLYPGSHTSQDECLQVITDSEAWLQSLYKDCKKAVAGSAPNFADSIYFKTTEKNRFHLYTTNSSLKIIESLQSKKQSTWANFHIKHLKTGSTISHADLDTFQMRLDAATANLARTLTTETKEACIAYVSKTNHLWSSIQSYIQHIDIQLCMAKTSIKYGWIQPTILSPTSEKPFSSVQCTGLRHPLIEYQKTRSQLVTHNVQLNSESNGWLLYGMNASGKSSLMKAVGIAVILAQIGCYVPAQTMIITPFQKIATRILNQDNLWAGLSSFAVEMSELRDIFQVADAQTLVLGDELCSGTESVSATSIVAAGVHWLHQKGACFVLATHLHDLMKLPVISQCPGIQVWHLHVEYDRVRDILLYHRNLRPGPGNTLYGLEVARALHLPQELIQLAHDYRHTLLGSSSAEEAPTSSWNAQITRKRCEVCKCEIQHQLEVHHLEERQHANKYGRNKSGTAINDARNLVVLCEKCHDNLHNDTISVGSVVDTSVGPQRSITKPSLTQPFLPQTLEKYRYKKNEPGWTTEEITNIQTILQEHKGLHPKLLLFQIQKTHPTIAITLSQLQSFMKK